MDMPAEALVAVCIEQGSVYHYPVELLNNDGTKYHGDRFFVVLSVNPKTDTVIVLATITTQIENQEKFIKRIGESPETLVRIYPSDFSRLSKESAVNCNNIYETSLSELIKKIDGGGKVFFEKLPKNKMDAIVSGALKSGQVSNEHKKLMI